MEAVPGGALRGRGGQMAVEVAVLAPVAIVLALVALNLMGFVEACAAFDQLAPDAVLAHGIAPAGDGETSPEREVERALADALGREGRCEVSVRAEDVASGEGEGPLARVSLLTRYVCTLTYRPWPRRLRMPGITLESPLSLRHERELVVDRYRPGVVF